MSITIDFVQKGIYTNCGHKPITIEKEMISMPGRDGTGPVGNSRGAGRGRRVAGHQYAGPGGFCVCPNCGHKVQHVPGLPCYQFDCPHCGAIMTREA